MLISVQAALLSVQGDTIMLMTEALLYLVHAYFFYLFPFFASFLFIPVVLFFSSPSNYFLVLRVLTYTELSHVYYDWFAYYYFFSQNSFKS